MLSYFMCFRLRGDRTGGKRHILLLWVLLLHARLYVFQQFQNCAADCFCLIDIVFFTVLIKYFFCVDIDSSSHAADFGTVGRTPHFGSQFFTSYFWLTKV